MFVFVTVCNHNVCLSVFLLLLFFFPFQNFFLFGCKLMEKHSWRRGNSTFENNSLLQHRVVFFTLLVEKVIHSLAWC